MVYKVIGEITWHYRVRAHDARVHTMHANTKLSKSSTPHNSTNMTPIEAALEEIVSLEPREDFSYTKIAKKHRVTRSTLSQRHQAVTASQAASSSAR